MSLLLNLLQLYLWKSFELGGGSNDESFWMVLEGMGGCRTPLGAVSGEFYSSLRLPLRVPAHAGRGVLGGGGGNLDRGSSASPSLG